MCKPTNADRAADIISYSRLERGTILMEREKNWKSEQEK
jgi:hypothetical protein